MYCNNRNNIVSTEVAQAQGGSVPAVAPGAGWEQLLEAFAASLQQKEATRRAYVKALVPFFRWIEQTGRDFRNLRREDILIYRDSLQAEGNARQPRTVSLYMTALRQLYGWISAETGRPNIVAGIKGAKVRRNASHGFERQPLTPAQASTLLDYMSSYHPARSSADGRHVRPFSESDLIALRNYAMVSTMLRCGLRTVEVSRLQVKNIAFNSGYRVLYVWGKGHEAPGAHSQPDDYVRLTDRAYEPIRVYLEARGDGVKPTDPLFCTHGNGAERGGRLSTRTVSQICKHGLRAIGLDDPAFTAHSLRHTTGETLAEQGVPLLDIQNALRHQDPTVTEIYITQAMRKLKLQKPATAVLDDLFDTDEQ